MFTVLILLGLCDCDCGDYTSSVGWDGLSDNRPARVDGICIIIIINFSATPELGLSSLP